MYTLGIQFGSHDTSASLIRDNQILAVVEQERFNHQKHTMEFPSDAIRYCLKHAGIGFSDLDFIAYANDASYTNLFKRTFMESGISDTFKPQLSSETYITAEIRKHLKEISPDSDRSKLYKVNHHLAHAASTFFTSPFDESAIFTIDGMGNWVTTTFAKGKNERIETIKEISHPHSLGLVYGAVTQYLGFKAASDESKVMGLASYGKPIYLNALREIVKYEDGNINLDLRYFTFHKKPLIGEDGKFNVWYSDLFADRFGPPRVPESDLTEFAMDMANSIQALLEERCFQLLNDLHVLIPSPNLCLAGGVALNSSMNGKIVDHTPFQNVYIIPAANDGGLSLGAALQCHADQLDKYIHVSLDNAYYGNDYSNGEIEREFTKLPDEISLSTPPCVSEAAAALLAEKQIIGWFQGRMEFGPRALGNRSILANPMLAETKDIVNRRVKFRENFRPFAPIVPKEYVNEYFEAKQEMPYMLKIVQVRESVRKVIPAVTHVDNTARVQTVTKEQNPVVHKLLEQFRQLTGVPVLLNTSFNIRGDTIVRTPYDAINCFLKTGMNALVIGPFLLQKPDCEVYDWKKI